MAKDNTGEKTEYRPIGYSYYLPKHKRTLILDDDSIRTGLKRFQRKFESMEEAGTKPLAKLFHYLESPFEVDDYQGFIDDESDLNDCYSGYHSQEYGKWKRHIFVKHENYERSIEWAELAKKSGSCIGTWAVEFGVTEETIKEDRPELRWIYALYDIGWCGFNQFNLPTLQRNTRISHFDLAAVNRGEKILLPNAYHADISDLVEYSIHAIDFLTAIHQQPKSVADKLEGSTGTKEDFYFVDKGSMFFIQGFGEAGHVKNLKGMRQIRDILMSPKPAIGVCCFELAGVNNHNQTEQKTIDDKAKRDYEKRLLELSAERRQAESTSDFNQEIIINVEYEQIQSVGCL